MKNKERDTPAFCPISCSMRTTNKMSVVERSGRNPHCSSGNSPLGGGLGVHRNVPYEFAIMLSR